MDFRIQLVSIIASGALFVVIFELVRQRRLMERYALLWMLSSVILLALSHWRGLWQEFAKAVGVAYAPSALFLVALAFILLLLLHFSLVISRLADQSKVLAQRVGMLQQEIDELRGEHAGVTPPGTAPEPQPQEVR
jgi:hypothetical protein